MSAKVSKKINANQSYKATFKLIIIRPIISRLLEAIAIILQIRRQILDIIETTRDPNM